MPEKVKSVVNRNVEQTEAKKLEEAPEIITKTIAEIARKVREAAEESTNATTDTG